MVSSRRAVPRPLRRVLATSALTCVRPLPTRASLSKRCQSKPSTADGRSLRGTRGRAMEGGQRTCQTAPNVVFESVEELKAHYKSDWHRYNLKRKARSLARVVSCARLMALPGGGPAYGGTRVV